MKIVDMMKKIKAKIDSYNLERYEGSLKAFKKNCSNTFTEFAISVKDNDLFLIIDGYHKGLLSQVIEEHVPDPLPFTREFPIKIFWNDFLHDPEADDFDTVGIYYAAVDIYGMKNPIPIHKYYRKPKEDEEGTSNWIEISEDEYYLRFKAAEAKEKGKNNERCICKSLY